MEHVNDYLPPGGAAGLAEAATVVVVPTGGTAVALPFKTAGAGVVLTATVTTSMALWLTMCCCPELLLLL